MRDTGTHTRPGPLVYCHCGRLEALFLAPAVGVLSYLVRGFEDDDSFLQKRHHWPRRCQGLAGVRSWGCLRRVGLCDR